MLIKRVIILAFCFGVVLPLHSWAGFDLIFERPALFRKTFVQVLNYGCLRNYEVLQKKQRIRSCAAAVDLFLKELNPIPVCFVKDDKSKVCGVVAFPVELKNLIDDPKVGLFLRRISSRLGDVRILPNSKFDLWAEAAPFWPRSSDRIRVLAILFQDTTRQSYHLGWLAGQRSQSGNLRDLRVFIKNLRDVFELRGDRNITLLPFSEPLNQMAAYHYYVVAELRARLAKRTDLAPGLDRLLPFLMNYTYEIKTTDAPLRNLVLGPKSIKAIYKIKDLYLGYLGVSHFAVPQNEILNLRQFYDVSVVNAGLLPRLVLRPSVLKSAQ